VAQSPVEIAPGPLTTGSPQANASELIIERQDANDGAIVHAHSHRRRASIR
jgi:hypothetical protein